MSPIQTGSGALPISTQTHKTNAQRKLQSIIMYTYNFPCSIVGEAKFLELASYMVKKYKSTHSTASWTIIFRTCVEVLHSPQCLLNWCCVVRCMQVEKIHAGQLQVLQWLLKLLYHFLWFQTCASVVTKEHCQVPLFNSPNSVLQHYQNSRTAYGAHWNETPWPYIDWLYTWSITDTVTSNQCTHRLHQDCQL